MFGGAMSVAHFLFGDDVRMAFNAVDEALYSYAMTHPSDDDDESHPGLRIPMTSHAIERVSAERSKQEKAVEPYMMLDRIGVAKPSPKPRWRLKEMVARRFKR